jgi:hypothetical protein
MFAFIAVFIIATYSVSQLTSLAPRALQGAASMLDALVGAGYLVLILSRMVYSSERTAGRVKRRVKMLE